MVMPIQQEEIAYNHHFEGIASPSREQVIDHHMPLRLQMGISSKGSCGHFRLFFKGFNTFHRPKYTHKKHPKQAANNTPLHRAVLYCTVVIQKNSTSLHPIKGVSQKKKKCILHLNRARFSYVFEKTVHHNTPQYTTLNTLLYSPKSLIRGPLSSHNTPLGCFLFKKKISFFFVGNTLNSQQWCVVPKKWCVVPPFFPQTLVFITHSCITLPRYGPIPSNTPPPTTHHPRFRCVEGLAARVSAGRRACFP